jgi:hypothetical protein
MTWLLCFYNVDARHLFRSAEHRLLHAANPHLFALRQKLRLLHGSVFVGNH